MRNANLAGGLNMKLNLPNYGCIRFELEADFIAPLDFYAGIRSVMERTSTHVHAPASADDVETTVAIFGSKFVIDGVSHRAVGNLSTTTRNDGLGIGVWMLLNKVEGDLPRPPRSIKPISVLTKMAARMFDSTRVDCSAIFEHDLAGGYRSGIALPMPLIVPDHPDGITHIESAEFSRRDNDGIRYRISLRQAVDAGIIVHTVNFASEIDWSPRSIRGLLNQAGSISARLLVRTGDR